MKNYTISNKTLVKRINFLLQSVNLSLGLLVGLSKRKIYKFLKKAGKINPKFAFDKDELRVIATFIANADLQKLTKKPKQTEIMVKLLNDERIVEEKDLTTYIVPEYEEPSLLAFVDRKQVMLC